MTTAFGQRTGLRVGRQGSQARGQSEPEARYGAKGQQSTALDPIQSDQGTVVELVPCSAVVVVVPDDPAVVVVVVVDGATVVVVCECG